MVLLNSPKDGRLYQEVLKDYKWKAKIDFVRVSLDEEITHPWTNKKVQARNVINNLGNVPSGTMTFIDANGNHYDDMAWSNLFIQYKLKAVELIDQYIASKIYEEHGFDKFLMAMGPPEIREMYKNAGKILINTYDNKGFDRFVTDLSGRQVALSSFKETLILVCGSENPLFERILKEIRFYLPDVKLIVESGEIDDELKKRYKIKEVLGLSEYKEGHPLYYYVSSDGYTIEAQGYTPMVTLAQVCGLETKGQFYRENLDIPLAEHLPK
jgi:hypothetical protein